MATLSGSIYDGINVWGWLQWGFDHEVNTTSTTYEYETPGGNTVILTGYDFAFEDGVAADGIIETLTIVDAGGNPIANMSLGNVSLEEAMADNLHNFWDVLLAGNDQIMLGNQDDTVSGFAGSDQIHGGAGNDNIDGGADNDQLNGGLGNDFVDGGAGDDQIIFNAENGDDTIYGGQGNDTVVHNGLTSEWGDIIQIEKVAAPYVGLMLDEPLVFNGSVKGDSFARKTYGSSDSEMLTAKQSDFDALNEREAKAPSRQDIEAKSILGDKIFEMPHHEVSSNELINGKKVLTGAFEQFDVSLEVGSTTGSGNPDEPGRTEATLRSVENLEIYGGVGGGSLSVGDLTGTSLENGRIIFDGGAGEDNLNALGTSTAISYVWRFEDGVGDPGDASINFGSSTEDIFHLVDHEDAGLNIKIGAAGNTVKIDEGITPGIGPSDLYVRNVESIDLDFGDGDDTVVVYEDIAGAYSGVLDVDFGEGSGDFDSTAHSGRVEVHGGEGQNIIFAGSGDDLLIGGAVHDHIFGGAGEDEIFGDGGADEIGGGEGNDTIEGGEGGDRFFFSVDGGTDTILDFEAGDVGGDRLDFIFMGLTEEDLTILQMGDDTHITTTLGTNVVLQNVLATDLNSDDFLTL